MLRVAFASAFSCLFLVTAIGAERQPASALSTVLFSSLDAGRSTFVSAGFKRALGGDLDRPGFVLLGGSGGGLDHYPSSYPGLGQVEVRSARGYLSIGFQEIAYDTVSAILIGAEAADRRLAPDDPYDRERRTRFGPRLQAEIWSRAIPGAVAQLVVIASLPRREVWARASYGWRVPGGETLGAAFADLHIEPEIAGSVQSRYSEGRIGLRMGELRVADVRLSVSAGGRSDSDGKRGGYATLTAHWRY